MKIKIVTPKGEQLDFNADYWEFSQNKFVNEDIVLVFYKNEIENITHKPSQKGILVSNSIEEELNIGREEETKV